MTKRKIAAADPPTGDEPTSAGMREMLAQTAFFGGLEPAALERIAAVARLDETHRGETLLEEGHRARDLVMLLGGRADVCIESITPNLEVTVARLGTGDVVGETLLLGEDVAHATIVVTEPGGALRVPVVALRAICREDAATAALLYARAGMLLRERLRRVNERLVSLKRKMEF